VLAGVLGPTLLAACGGGGDDAGASGGASSSGYTSGPITGLGSIIVGGVRFEDNGARVEDEDGTSRNRSELRLGMVVEVESSSIDDSVGRGVAALVRFGAEMKGPVASIDPAAQTLRVLDQTVEVRGETVFDALLVGGFSAIRVGQILEIHALFDSTSGRYLATRIELEDNASEYRLRGVISQHDGTAKTFRIGDAVINYASADITDVPSLADGQRVRVRLRVQAGQDTGPWVATRVRRGVRNIDGVADARIRGFVNAFASATQFQVNGIPVDATNARVEGTVREGALVEVRGHVANGTLIASRVKVIDRLGDEIQRFELHGQISALDTAAQTFMLREVKVSYANVLEWKDGSAADLADGKEVEVKGLWAEDRSVMRAVVIEFE
jgi:hypothetical protein